MAQCIALGFILDAKEISTKKIDIDEKIDSSHFEKEK